MADFGPEDIIRGGRFGNIPPEKMRQLLINGGGVLMALVLLLTSFYMVNPDEVGVIQRFGRYVRTTTPGPHFKLPLWIEKVTNVPVKHEFTEQFGFRTLRSGVRTEYVRGDFSNESLMLTGDLNNAVVEWAVHYRISDAREFIFDNRNPRETIRDMSEVAMRQIVGDRSVNEVITTGRQELEGESQKKLQEIMDSYHIGVEIRRVELQDVNPPDAVAASFAEVNQAKQEREKLINQAWEDYNKVIPKAKGEAEKVIREAEGYLARRVNEAEGDANRFLATWEEYKNAKEVTRKRLYLETLTDLLPRLKTKIVVDEDLQGILPLLDLSKEMGVE
ncbi:MAG: FtsH protease activity modulator HflK [Candidatus Omnitrophica bacterium]|nr:FtsH protease activity modulator HflK [Candidatus Omnitrophota bacterium]